MLAGVVFRHPLTITAARHIANPVVVIKIPADGFADPTVKCFQRVPMQFAFDFARVHRVAAVVPGPIFDECHQFVVRDDGIMGAQFVEQLAHGTDNLQVLFSPPPPIL